MSPGLLVEAPLLLLFLENYLYSRVTVYLLYIGLVPFYLVVVVSC
uniref:Uncharacterized protein n=1 Tax=Picea glauca TaxID=3330 RepID=A0A101LUH2_PICGL|nr:hypothetical protein ABT39_MTgene2424 [Picea glauca]QHR86778.1 hypothetical protein Q903MT_gene782 [Picea sitchensis]